MSVGRARLSDIAAEAGVSQATVSRVFNKPDLVKPATREKVVRATQQLGFGSPALQTIGLIVPDASNPFFSQLIYFFERELSRHGTQVVSASSDGKTDREVEVVDRFRAMGVEGIVYTPARSGGEAILELVSRGDIPVLAFDRNISTGNLDCVTTASRAATQALVDYLYNLGHREFGYIRGAASTTTADDRFEAFVHALSRNGLTLDDSLVFQGDYRPASGRDFAERYLMLTEQDRPTAVIAANDLMAIGFIQRVQESGFRVPVDVSVAGFDGIEYGAWYSPSLTTIVQPVRRLVHEASAMLLERMAATRRGTEPIPPRRLPVEPRFVVRDSVGEAPSAITRRASIRVLTNSDNI